MKSHDPLSDSRKAFCGLWPGTCPRVDWRGFPGKRIEPGTAAVGLLRLRLFRSVLDAVRDVKSLPSRDIADGG